MGRHMSIVAMSLMEVLPTRSLLTLSRTTRRPTLMKSFEQARTTIQRPGSTRQFDIAYHPLKVNNLYTCFRCYHARSWPYHVEIRPRSCRCCCQECRRDGLQTQFDCAHIYGNEKEIGETFTNIFQAGTSKREDLCIQSKLWNTDHAVEDVESVLKILCSISGSTGQFC